MASGDDGANPQPRGLARWVPGLQILRTYQRAWLGRDVIAGLVLTAILLPTGMGYAIASGLPPITGLYATIIPLVVYAVFGPSRILVLGPDSALVALIAVAVVGPSAGDPQHAIALASALALLVGAFSIAGGLLRIGVVTNLLSKPVRVGYMHGIGLTVLVGQLPKLLGFSVEGTGLLDEVPVVVRAILDGRTNLVALAIGGSCLAAILALRAIAPRFPGGLLALVGVTLVVVFGGLGGRLAVVGPVPAGMPLPSFPAIQLAELPNLAVAAIGIALVAFADTSVLSRVYAGRLGMRIDPDHELVALGLTNVGAGLFQGFPVCASASRTPVAEAAGAKTQAAGLVGALAVVVVLVAVPWAIRDLPIAALAAIVIAAALGLFDLRELRVFYRVRRADFVLAVLAFAAVAVFGVIVGIGVAVGVSILDFVRRAWRPHDAILGRAEGVKGYHDIRRYPEAKQIPGLVLFRWDAPLFFANADTFRTRILDVVASMSPRPAWVIVTAEPITDIDTTAAEMIEELDEELAVLGVSLAFAEMKDPVKDRLRRYELKTRLAADRFFPTIGVAVKAFLAQHEVPWVDWEEARDH